MVEALRLSVSRNSAFLSKLRCPDFGPVLFLHGLGVETTGILDEVPGKSDILGVEAVTSHMLGVEVSLVGRAYRDFRVLLGLRSLSGFSGLLFLGAIGTV